MRLNNLSEFDSISEMMLLRRHHGLTKISFKDCTLNEAMVSQLTSKLGVEHGLISDLTL